MYICTYMWSDKTIFCDFSSLISFSDEQSMLSNKKIFRSVLLSRNPFKKNYLENSRSQFTISEIHDVLFSNTRAWWYVCVLPYGFYLLLSYLGFLWSCFSRLLKKYVNIHICIKTNNCSKTCVTASLKRFPYVDKFILTHMTSCMIVYWKKLLTHMYDCLLNDLTTLHFLNVCTYVAVFLRYLHLRAELLEKKISLE